MCKAAVLGESVFGPCLCFDPIRKYCPENEICIKVRIFATESSR